MKRGDFIKLALGAMAAAVLPSSPKRPYKEMFEEAKRKSFDDMDRFIRGLDVGIAGNPHVIITVFGELKYIAHPLFA